MPPNSLCLNDILLSVIVPCFDEKATIAAILKAVRASEVPRIELVVVDDFSTDGTRDLLTGELRPLIDKLVLQPRNGGKGSALRAALPLASGDIVVIQDADLEYHPSEYPRLLQPLLEGKADVVYGSRFLGTSTGGSGSGVSNPAASRRHRWANHFLTSFSNLSTRLRLTDMETGCKMFRREIIQSITIEEERFALEPEITAKLARKGCIFQEVGISYQARTYAEGKKITWRDGFRACYAIIKYGYL